jgi:hypothetical protein
MTDDTPIVGANYIVRELRSDLNGLRKDVQEYHIATVRTTDALDAHIKECDRRYAETESTAQNRYGEMHDAAVRNDQALVYRKSETKVFSKSWVVKQVADKVLTWIFWTLLAAIYFAFEHGFKVHP